MSDRERRAMGIFEEWLDLPDSEQAAFLADSCGNDAELRREVEALIESDRQSTSLSEAFRAEIADLAEIVAVAQPGHIGETLNQRYVVEKRLGAGGVGVVFLARDTGLHDRPVVVKVLHETSRDNPWLVKKFELECAALARIDHPNVVKVLDRGLLSDGQPFLVMEFVKGQTLAEFLESLEKPLDLETATAVIGQIGEAVGAVHAQGVIHRDIKTNNVMLSFLPNGTLLARLIDFGIAKLTDAGGGDRTTKPLTVGTLPYMAPELFDGGEASVESDLYALGVIAFEVLTGTKPFQAKGSNPFAQMLEYRTLQEGGVAGRLTTMRPDLPETVDPVFQRVLSFFPENRYRRVGDFLADLKAAIAETTRPTAPRERFVMKKHDESTIDSLPTLVTSGNPASPSRSVVSRSWKWGALALCLAVGVVAGWFALQPRVRVPTAAPAAVVPLPFSLSGVPRQARSGEEFRFTVTLLRPGYVYVVNESPRLGNGALPVYTVLFPSPRDNGGSSRFSPGTLSVPPEGPGLVFSGARGTEKLWVCWSAASIPILETARPAANRVDDGTPRDAATVAALREFLSSAVNSDHLFVHCVSIEHL